MKLHTESIATGLLISCGILVVLVILISVALYRNYKLNKKLSSESDDYLEKLNELSTVSKENENKYRSALAVQFRIMGQIAVLEHLLNDEEVVKNKKLIQKVNEIVFGRKEGVNWIIIYQIINNMYDGYLDALKVQLPELSEKEFRICCLTYAGLNNTQIGIILRIALDTVQSKKTNIRRKTGLGKNSNLKEFLATFRNE